MEEKSKKAKKECVIIFDGIPAHDNLEDENAPEDDIPPTRFLTTEEIGVILNASNQYEIKKAIQ